MPLNPADPSRRDVLRAAIAGSGSLLWAGILAELSRRPSPAGTAPRPTRSRRRPPTSPPRPSASSSCS